MNPVTPPTTIVPALPDSRLAGLIAEYAKAHAEAKQTADRLNEIVTAIKSALYQAAPTSAKTGTESGGVRLVMTHVEQTRIDTDRMKREDPSAYARFGRKIGTWRLDRVVSS